MLVCPLTPSICSPAVSGIAPPPASQITTTRVRDVAAFSLDFLDDEAVLPFATHLTVAGVFVDGAAADAVPEAVPERSICIVRLVAGCATCFPALCRHPTQAVSLWEVGRRLGALWIGKGNQVLGG